MNNETAHENVNKFLIKRPLINEKATQASSMGTYFFLVAPRATKPEIAKTLKAIYKVDVERVHIVNIKPKTRRLGRSIGVKPGYKKALVTLKKGQKLDILPVS